ncbi:MAG: triose-phosphate isomerase [Candidatus Adiutrix sp.]|jgi:triosephosphate isomerase|nr:triose-phosphate isomerase [Candidatus Adiutrix sp.]
MSRKTILAGNWKMFKTSAEARQFFSQLLPLITPLKPDREVALGVPFPSLEAAAAAVADSPVAIGAQDIFWEDQGAFTGEVSGPMIRAAGATAVIIGHSERRQLFGETGQWVNQKLRAALRAGLAPIVCLGETRAERESGQTFEVLGRQLAEGLAGFAANELAPLVLAYEPVWAIGTGLTATPEQAQETHAAIRQWLGRHLGPALAADLRILYGGSVKPDNVARLMSQPDLDGALVGGASLEAAAFARIVNFDD